jgi:site-specific recombinase XerD
VAGFYEYAIDEGGLARSPAAHVNRPNVAEDSPSTGLDRDGLRALLAAARADGRRSEALITLLALNGLRINEALSRDVTDLDTERSHRVLRLVRKGSKRATAVLSAPTVRAIESYLDGRDSGPIFITKTGRRFDQPAAWRLVRRLARTADVAVDKLNPHGFRHILSA